MPIANVRMGVAQPMGVLFQAFLAVQLATRILHLLLHRLPLVANLSPVLEALVRRPR